MSRFAALALLALIGCGSPDDSNQPATGSSTGVGTTGIAAGSLTGTPTGTLTGTPTDELWTWTTPPWEEPVDCTLALPIPLSTVTHTFVPGHEDFTFTPDGRWVGTAGENLAVTPHGGPLQVIIPGVGSARGTRILPDQTVVMARVEDASLVRADPTTGASWVVRSGLTNPNGIAIGLDGWVYLATTGQILKIDPEDGTTEIVAEISGRSFDGLTFSPDFTRLYFNEEIGRLHYVEFDAAGVPGDPVSMGQLPIGGFSLLDGMTMDACGNVWAVEMGGKVWRIAPDGTVDMAVNLPAGAFSPALNFGPGTGGFEKTTLWVQDFIGRAFEVEVGVPGKWEPHLPWN